MKTATVYTDGGCKKHLKIASYAYFVDSSLKGSGLCEGFVTPTASEVLAVVIALNRLRKMDYLGVIIKTDSKYVEGVISNAEYWKSIPKHMKSHYSLIQRLFKQLSYFVEARVEWIPENSEEGNGIAHALATAQIRRKEAELVKA